jgi:predicted secreted protein
MHRILLTAIIIGIATTAFSTANCAGLKPKKVISDMGCTKEITKGDSGSLVELHVGDTLCVRLQTKPGTGYSWIIESLDSSFVKQVDYQKPAESTKEAQVGASETARFVFITKVPGKTTIVMVYKRIWETKTPPIDSFRVSLSISVNPAIK